MMDNLFMEQYNIQMETNIMGIIRKDKKKATIASLSIMMVINLLGNSIKINLKKVGILPKMVISTMGQLKMD
jgi:hypothetical protein